MKKLLIILLLSSCCPKMHSKYIPVKILQERHKADRARKNALIYFILILTIGKEIS